MCFLLCFGFALIFYHIFHYVYWIITLIKSLFFWWNPHSVSSPPSLTLCNETWQMNRTHMMLQEFHYLQSFRPSCTHSYSSYRTRLTPWPRPSPASWVISGHCQHLLHQILCRHQCCLHLPTATNMQWCQRDTVEIQMDVGTLCWCVYFTSLNSQRSHWRRRCPWSFSALVGRAYDWPMTIRQADRNLAFYFEDIFCHFQAVFNLASSWSGAVKKPLTRFLPRLHLCRGVFSELVNSNFQQWADVCHPDRAHLQGGGQRTSTHSYLTIALDQYLRGKWC